MREPGPTDARTRSPRSGRDINARWLAELGALGYRDRDRPVQLAPTSVGGLDRDAVAEQVLARLGAGRSAWNAADIRGEVEQSIASAGVVTGGAVRAELAEDLTARALNRCVPLLTGSSDAVPEHIRALTSRAVLAVEADLTVRFAARGALPTTTSATDEGIHPVPRTGDDSRGAVVAALTGNRPLLVVEGAAGAGKTTTLATTRALLELHGRGLMVVTPTLKAAKVAAAEVGTATGSAAWLAFQYGWRWTGDGVWIRLCVGQADPVTGHVYRGPVEKAQLRPGDLLVVDEAGMLDQDTARALLIVADECQARVALIGDRHQLAAVGRGGVLDLAITHADPGAHLTLAGVHRFIRTDRAGRSVPDTEYADLTLSMRAGEDPGAVFKRLAARGQIRLHPDEAALQASLATTAAASFSGGDRVAVVADTREQTAALNVAIRERLVAHGWVDDTRVVTTRAAQRIGVGDRIATRHNDYRLGVANRDTWTVTAVDPHGGLYVTLADATPTSAVHRDVTPAGGSGRVLPARYITDHVELAYASTAHGVQGDTVTSAHLVIGEHTGAASAYVGMTRGRTANVAHLVAADLAEARQRWVAVFARDGADLGPGHAGAWAAVEAARYVSCASPAVRRPRPEDMRRPAQTPTTPRGIGI